MFVFLGCSLFAEDFQWLKIPEVSPDIPYLKDVFKNIKDSISEHHEIILDKTRYILSNDNQTVISFLYTKNGTGMQPNLRYTILMFRYEKEVSFDNPTTLKMFDENISSLILTFTNPNKGIYLSVFTDHYILNGDRYNIKSGLKKR